MPEKKISKTDTKTKINESSGDTTTPKADTKTKSNEASSDKNSSNNDKISSKTEANSTSNEPSDNTSSNYVRGESQKPVTKAYRDNWKTIFGKKR